MSEYIERKAAIENVLDQMTHSKNQVCMYERLMNMESADVVSRAAYDQTDWERCIALTQLKEIGKGLGERMDDVRPVVTCADCKFNKRKVTDLWGNDAVQCITGQTHRHDWFCADGKKREES